MWLSIKSRADAFMALYKILLKSEGYLLIPFLLCHTYGQNISTMKGPQNESISKSVL